MGSARKDVINSNNLERDVSGKPESPFPDHALEHVPFRWKHLNDQDMLQLIDVERFLIGHMIPCDRKTL
jgi:hypothetical protein